MLFKDKLANLDFKSKTNNAKHILLPFSSFIYLFLFKELTKTTQNEMHECYAMQILEKNKENKNNKEEWSQRVER